MAKSNEDALLESLESQVFCPISLISHIRLSTYISCVLVWKTWLHVWQ